ASPTALLMAGGVIAETGSGKTLTDSFPSLLLYKGAGGGGGTDGFGTYNPGGNGGGVIYIECNELVLTGAISAKGAKGTDADFASAAGNGGGGGGGVILGRARKLLTNFGTVSAEGGLGGPSIGADNGGTGGHGFWDVVEIP